jgi:hypothetical protein
MSREKEIREKKRSDSQLSDAKLRELILYIADQSQNDIDFGMTKLNKILFNADFTSYARTGTSVTGTEYQALPKGPCARRLRPVLGRLLKDKEAAIKMVPRGFTQKRVVALREPDLSKISAEDIALVHEIIDLFRGMTATKVSTMSHDFPGWQDAEEGQTIPYHTVFRSYRPLTDRERKRGWELSEAQ